MKVGTATGENEWKCGWARERPLTLERASASVSISVRVYTTMDR